MLSQPPKTNVKELNKRQRQKAKKKNFARVSRVFVHFFAVVADYNVKLPIFSFVEDANTT